MGGRVWGRGEIVGVPVIEKGGLRGKWLGRRV